MFLTAPIAGRLMNKVDPRIMLAVGFLSFAVAAGGGLISPAIGTSGSSSGRALGQQLQQLMQITHTQGLVMAFADAFFLLMLLFVALAALAVIIKKPPGVHGA